MHCRSGGFSGLAVCSRYNSARRNDAARLARTAAPAEDTSVFLQFSRSGLFRDDAKVCHPSGHTTPLMVVSLSRSLWNYRGFVFSSVRREFQARYKNSLFGAAWSVLNPLAMVVVYTIVFSQVMRARLPNVDTTFAYSIYLCAGIFTWGLFSEIITRCQNVFIDNANLIKKISFPRICLPAIVVTSACLNFTIVLALFIGFLIVTGNFPGLVVFALFPVLVIEIAFAVGLGMLVGVLNVFFRDVGHFFSIVLQFWFWLTPIVYTMSIVPENFRGWFALNPLSPIFTSYQNLFVSSTVPDWFSLAYPAICALILCAVGLFIYRRNVADMVDEL